MKKFMHKSLYRKTGSARVLSCLFAFVMVILGLSHPMSAKADENVIKVGYIEQGNFIENNYGTYTGYGVEYLEYVSQITGWKYEFIQDTWENCLSNLEKGEIDLICMAQYSEERAEKFLYSDISLGYDFTLLYAKNDSEICYEDYEAMQGQKTGLLSASKMSEAFLDVAKANNLEIEPVYYKTEGEIMEALDKG